MIKLKKKKTFCYVYLVFLHAKMVNWGIDEEKMAPQKPLFLKKTTGRDMGNMVPKVSFYWVCIYFVNVYDGCFI